MASIEMLLGMLGMAPPHIKQQIAGKARQGWAAYKNAERKWAMMQMAHYATIQHQRNQIDELRRKLENTITDPASLKIMEEAFRKELDDIKKNGQTVECAVCMDESCDPSIVYRQQQLENGMDTADNYDRIAKEMHMPILMTKCGHTVCYGCAGQMVRAAHGHSVRSEPVETVTLKCPHCRTETPITETLPKLGAGQYLNGDFDDMTNFNPVHINRNARSTVGPNVTQQEQDAIALAAQNAIAARFSLCEKKDKPIDPRNGGKVLSVYPAYANSTCKLCDAKVPEGSAVFTTRALTATMVGHSNVAAIPEKARKMDSKGGMKSLYFCPKCVGCDAERLLIPNDYDPEHKTVDFATMDRELQSKLDDVKALYNTIVQRHSLLKSDRMLKQQLNLAKAADQDASTEAKLKLQQWSRSVSLEAQDAKNVAFVPDFVAFLRKIPDDLHCRDAHRLMQEHGDAMAVVQEVVPKDDPTVPTPQTPPVTPVAAASTVSTAPISPPTTQRRLTHLSTSPIRIGGRKKKCDAAPSVVSGKRSAPEQSSDIVPVDDADERPSKVMHTSASHT